MRKWIVFCLIFVLCLQLFACAAPGEELPEVVAMPGGNTVDLMAAVQAAAVEPLAPDQVYQTASANFALRLLQCSYEEGGVLLSPYSVYAALAITANGADGETLAQMEQALGLPAGELNHYLYSLGKDDRRELLLANSIWFREAADFRINESFLQTNADFYGAQLYRAAFDEKTVEDVNAWVREHTDGRIEQLIQALNPNDRMLLLNTLCFDGVWAAAFEAENSFDGTFTACDGSSQDVRMMQGFAEGYIAADKAVGFVKEYENGYSFLALLPEEGLSIREYIDTLNSAALLEMWNGASPQTVSVTMPKAELQGELSLTDALKAMGIVELFSEQADLGRISDSALYVSDVMHSSCLSIDEEGTKAAAATGVVITEKSAARLPESVVLDRPFVLAILDNETGTILFLGTVESMG